MLLRIVLQLVYNIFDDHLLHHRVLCLAVFEERSDEVVGAIFVKDVIGFVEDGVGIDGESDLSQVPAGRSWEEED